VAEVSPDIREQKPGKFARNQGLYDLQIWIDQSTKSGSAIMKGQL